MTSTPDPFIPLTDQQAASAQNLPENLHVRGAVKLSMSATKGPQAVGGFPLPPEPRT